MPDDDEGRDTTVRCCLKKAVVPGAKRASVDSQAVLDIIDEAVIHVSKLAARGSQVVLLTVLRTLDINRGSLPDDFFGSSLDTFFDQCFKVGLPSATEPKKKKEESRSTTNRYIHQTYSVAEVAEALANQTVPRKPGDSNLLVYASQSYQTNFLNFFDYELERRILTFIKSVWRWKFPEKTKQPPKGTRFKCFRFASEPWNERLSLPESLPDDLVAKLVDCRQRYENILKAETSRRNAIKNDADEVTRVLAASQKTDTDKEDAARSRKVLKKRRESLRQRGILWRIELVYWLLKEIEKLECEWSKGFAMTPLTSLQRKHIRIDNTVFSTFLFSQLRDAGYYPSDMKSSGVKGMESDHLSALFEVAGLRSKKAGWKQGASYQTDGYALCIRFVKNKEPGSGRRSNKKADSEDDALRQRVTKKRKTADFENASRVPANVGMDQGLVNPYCAAWIGDDGSVRHKMLTRTTYYVDSGITRHREITRRREKRLRNTREAQSATCARSTDWSRTLAYVKTIDEHSKRIWEQYDDKRLSRSRMVAEMGKVSVLDRWCRVLKSELRESGVSAPLMGVGFPSFNSSMPGCLSAPTTKAYKALLRHFNTIPADEYMTSQVDPSNPESLLVKPKKLVNVNGEMKYREVRGIRLCPESTLESRASRCYDRDPELWRGYLRLLRDVVGALNIMKVAGLCNEDRPGLLKRTNRCYEASVEA